MTIPQSSSRSLTRRDFLERGAAIVGGLAAFPSLARFRLDGDTFSLTTDGIAAEWTVAGGSFRVGNIADRIGNRAMTPAADAFVLKLQDGGAIRASGMRVTSGPKNEMLHAEGHAARYASRLEGTAVRLELEDPKTGLRATWRAIGRHGSHYLRQEITLRPTYAPVPVSEIVLVDIAAQGAEVVGEVKGSPVVAGNLYFGFEHPLSLHEVDGTHATGVLPRALPLRPGTSFTVSSVIGTTATGQLRRDFLAYLERERAHPYRTFLHYNSWYDLGYFNKYDEAGALDRIHAFGDQLHVKRGVTLKSFLFDDGWDDSKTLWHFNSGFPDGFTNVRKAAAQYGAAPGVWLSPWGGYGKPRQERIEYGKKQGYETNEGGFVLSGPKYYKLFHDTCVNFIKQYGVNQFKFDGTGNASHVYPGSKFDSDFDAMISLIGDLRDVEPDLYVNLTTGTYPSPFWLRYCDSIWRGGDDHSFAGVGPAREQWITYRDGDTYAGIVKKGPLYPLNSLMLHGLIYAQHANRLDSDPHNDFRNEVRSYFGTGTQLQEMYITPSLLSDQNWDDLAQAARWSADNAGTLVDTHWVGGDPVQLEPYGWASWSTAKGILVLRNPSDKPQKIDVDVGRTFELPEGTPQTFSASPPWRARPGGPRPMAMSLRLRAGTPHAFQLEPFEVLTLEATSAGA
ncbi:MAG TPA: enterotoxin [Gemmatimonadales bacterium]|nr:enterotoxin [Gemmatimonadales bacterium]